MDFTYTDGENGTEGAWSNAGTVTAVCDHGCGETHTHRDWGSKLAHEYKGGICIHCGAKQWLSGIDNACNAIMWTGYMIVSAIILFFELF